MGDYMSQLKSQMEPAALRDNEHLPFDYKLIKTKRKTISLSVNNELQVIVRAPMHVSKKFIDSFVEKHTQWIEKQKKRNKL